MLELFSYYYLWVKSFHLISIVAWMAGLLYLPRLFIYHCSADSASDKSETFKIMERRLLRLIMNPAMIATFVFGSILVVILHEEISVSYWFYIKSILVFGLFLSHMFMVKCYKLFQGNKNIYTEKFYRIFNEVPTILMICIVIITVVKPI